MDTTQPLYDLAPLARMMLLGIVIALGPLAWVWLRTDAQPLAEPLKSATAAATVLQVDPQALGNWLQPAAGQRLQDHLYVVDPIGNWMMRFPANADPKQIKRDLDRLLRASAFWDKSGRPTDVAPAVGN